MNSEETRIDLWRLRGAALLKRTCKEVTDKGLGTQSVLGTDCWDCLLGTLFRHRNHSTHGSSGTWLGKIRTL